jgi:putative DNA primase/helicase
MQAHLSKYRGLIPSLALLIHLADTDIPGPQTIGLPSLEKALHWYAYLLGMAKRIYSHVPPAEMVAAKLLLSRLHKLPNPFTPRLIQQRGWAGLRTLPEISDALEVLCDAYQLRIEVRQTGGRPSTVYHRAEA